MSYTKPKQLLTINSQKTIKSQKKGYDTYIMYLTPHKDNASRANACPNASKGCIAACLFNSGNARFNQVQAGRYNKSNYLIEDPKVFLEQLDQEIGKLSKRYLKKSNKLCIRLNGTSDWAWENKEERIDIIDGKEVKIPSFVVRDGKNIFELYPEIQFYDYTKTAARIGNTPANYHLTFSRSESNQEEVIQVLNGGGNVAAVFTELPETYLGYPVVDGDQDDLRFLDGSNVVVGLTHKKASTKGGGKRNDLAISSGFVIETDKLEQAKEVA
jgi:hypothetical protein